jgi:hypothetical protein
LCRHHAFEKVCSEKQDIPCKEGLAAPLKTCVETDCPEILTLEPTFPMGFPYKGKERKQLCACLAQHAFQALEQMQRQKASSQLQQTHHECQDSRDVERKPVCQSLS